MRISDWSSDVCSSDLGHRADKGVGEPRAVERHLLPRAAAAGKPQFVGLAGRVIEQQPELDHHRAVAALDAERRILEAAAEIMVMVDRQRRAQRRAIIEDRGGARVRKPARRMRTEEHTSELQSLMRISYPVLCLKKQN